MNTSRRCVRHFRSNQIFALPLAGLIASVVSASALASGPLNPPAGPIQPTPGPEPRVPINELNTPGDADSLYRIDKPGSYYLEARIDGEAGMHGIEIAAGNVSIDLMGFAMIGVEGSRSGISSDLKSLIQGIHVRNGFVREWGGSGIDMRTTVDSVVIEDIVSRENGDVGIRVGSTAVVRDCQTNQNGTDGIQAGVVSVVEGCSANGNGRFGIQASQSNVFRCIANNNEFAGINAGSISIVENCNLQLNARDGIAAGSRCIVRQNVCALNGSGEDGANIHATGSDNRIEYNNCFGADRGIDVDLSGNIIIGNSVSNAGTNYDIVANNVCFVVTAATSAAISGSSGGVSPGTSNPWANFSY